MKNTFSKLFQATLAGFIVTVFVLALAIAQNAPASQSKKSGASSSCDGALDIVPSKPMTFVRKRRPAKLEEKPHTVPADSKPAQKQPGDSKQGK